jgi:ABC-2 type transport system ATP-binding protein
MLAVSNIRKEFATLVAVDGVSFEVQKGEIFGLLGPNGAGKTTTIRIILNILEPDEGEVLLFGNRFSEKTKNIVGYLPEERGLYRKNKLLSSIVYFAGLKGMSVKEAKQKALAWLERFEIQDYANRKIEELSKGNQQKVQFIISVLHNPDLLILDEPFSGFDPVNQILLKDILQELRKEGKAIVFSTHQMEQAERLCDKICLINNGKVVLLGSVHAIRGQYGKNSVHVEFDGDGSFLKQLPFIRKADIYGNYAELEMNDGGGTNDLLKSIVGRLDVRKFEIVEPSLNSIFIDIVSETVVVQGVVK